MYKIILILLIAILTIQTCNAYAIKVYDQWGNRVGTYKKEGENFILYDFYDKKIEKPEELIENAPSQKTLSEYTQYFYDENMMPIGSFSTGMWSNTGKYYPGRRYIPRCFYPSGNNYIISPRQLITNPHGNSKPNIYIKKTGF